MVMDLAFIMEYKQGLANVWCDGSTYCHETGHEWFGNSVTASVQHIFGFTKVSKYTRKQYILDKFDSYEVGVHY